MTHWFEDCVFELVLGVMSRMAGEAWAYKDTDLYPLLLLSVNSLATWDVYANPAFPDGLVGACG